METNDKKKSSVESPTVKSPEKLDASTSRLKDVSSKDRGITVETGQVKESSWKGEKAFAVEANQAGQTTRIEGWLSSRETPRSAADKKQQSDVKKTADASQDAGHLIAHSLGGPRAEKRDSELSKANLLPMDARINRSHLNVVEQTIHQDLKAGKQIYCQAQVNYRERADGRREPVSVTHRFFEKDNEGRPQAYKISEVTTKIDSRPSQTLDQSVKQATGGRDRATDFASPTRRGVAPGEH